MILDTDVWQLTGKQGSRKLTRYNGDHEAREWLFEADGDLTFKNKLRELQGLQQPAVEKTKTTVTERHLLRRVGAKEPLRFGPFDTANDAVITAAILSGNTSTKYEAITRKTTVEETIL
jgi:hypothetical protein